jgi:AcrR family transcriptional regulator
MAATTPRQARSEETQRRILAACDRLLAERPFERISMQDIAREAGVSVGNLYNRFPDKNGLVDHVLADYQARFHQAVAAQLDTGDGALDTYARLQAIVEHFAAAIVSLRPLMATMASRLARGEPVGAAVKNRSEALIELCVDWLRAADEGLDPERCRFAVASITASLQFDLLFGTSTRMFGEAFRERLAQQAFGYLMHPGPGVTN